MRTLSIELSSDVGSLASVEEGRLLFQKEWPAETRQRRPVFADLLALVESGTIELSRVHRLAVGVGPGAFSGLRLAVSLGRQEVWAGAFGVVDGMVEMLHKEWVVTPVTDLPPSLALPGSVWVSADWKRIGVVLAAHCPQSVQLIQEARVPDAAMVAGLVEDLVGLGRRGEPRVPIYVHPAVSIAPRF